MSDYSQGYSTVGSEARPLGSRWPEFLNFSGLFDSNLFLAARGLGTLEEHSLRTMGSPGWWATSKIHSDEVFTSPHFE